MLKFALIITICSALDGSCLYSLQRDKLFSTHYDCAVAGYQHSQTMLRSFGKDKVNEAKVLITFKCKPTEGDSV